MFSFLKHGVGQNIAMHASATARNVLLVLISAFPGHSSSFLFGPNPLLPVQLR